MRTSKNSKPKASLADPSLREAIERYEALYLTAENFSIRAQIWQTLIYLRERVNASVPLKSKR